MRPLLSTISILFFTATFAQTSSKITVFKIEDFSNLSNKNKIRTVELKLDSLLNFTFYRKHFFMPNYFPEKFIDTNYKNQTVTVWQDTTKEKIYKTNWTHTYNYDNKSRVTEYTFSGCFICSNLPYTIKIFYGTHDKVVKMEKYYGLEIPKKDNTILKELSSHPRPVETYIFSYDYKGNIIQLEYFLTGVLNKRITKA